MYTRILAINCPEGLEARLGNVIVVSKEEDCSDTLHRLISIGVIYNRRKYLVYVEKPMEHVHTEVNVNGKSMTISDIIDEALLTKKLSPHVEFRK